MSGYSPAPSTGGADREAPLKPTGARADIKKNLTNNINADTEEITDILYKCANSSRRGAVAIHDNDGRQR